MTTLKLLDPRILIFETLLKPARGTSMGKAASNELRKIRALFFVYLSAGSALIAIAMLAAPFFLRSFQTLSLKAVFLAGCPALLLLILSWFWHLQALQIVSETED
ncbi:hypothetical protein [Bradyrhizobium liaoningense]